LKRFPTFFRPDQFAQQWPGKRNTEFIAFKIRYLAFKFCPTPYHGQRFVDVSRQTMGLLSILPAHRNF
jgi:hypothetical protein